MKIPKALIGKLTYSGKCNDYDNQGNLSSPLFGDATEMAQIVESENVVDLNFEEFKKLVSAHEDFIPKGVVYQINLVEGIAWAYNENEDIHYFYSL